MASKFEDRVRETGIKLYQVAEKSKPSLFKKDFYTGKMMDLCMKNEAFKQEMFRFVDVFPYLSRPESVARHIQEYFCRPDQDFPKSMQWGLKRVKPDSMVAKIAAKSIAKNINSMGKQFITGETIEKAAQAMKQMRDREGVAWTVKILKEAVKSTREEEAFLSRQIDLMESYADIAKNWPSLGESQKGGMDWGFTPQTNISLMASCLYSQYLSKSCAVDYAIDRAKERLRPIYRKAMQIGAYVMLDMEHLPARGFTLELFKRMNEEPEFRDWPHKGIAYQSYLKDAEPLLIDLLDWAKKSGQDFGIRLIKGAFWDEEVVRANLNNYPIPVFADKQKTDACFERCTRTILENHANIMLKCGSHNIRSAAFVLETAKDLDVPKNRVEFQMLHGMAENLRVAWRQHGMRLRLYSPVGEIIPGMAYLVRRLLENTSSESFLRLSFADGVAMEQMLKDPALPTRETSQPVATASSDSARDTLAVFTNTTPLSWTEKNRTAFAAALKKVKAEFSLKIKPRIGGKIGLGEKETLSMDPNEPEQVVGIVDCAGKPAVVAAVNAAANAFEIWSMTPVDQRVSCLFAAADQVKKRRHELAALLVYEAGETWNEAQGNINEAIDLLTFYATQMERLAIPRQMAGFPGESSQISYIPRGIGAVIAPGYAAFPVSIGMIAAATVTGNTVVYKPSSKAPVIGNAVCRLFENAGLPKGVLNFVPGLGSDIGDALVTHPDVAFTVFTGSRETGLRIIQQSASTPIGAAQIKHVIAEMGGKNAVIIDSDADLDAAMSPIIQSAFTYMGQKCSAASRLIVLEENYDKFLVRFKKAVETLMPGKADDPRTDIGAVISEKAKEKIISFIELGKKEGTVLVHDSKITGMGHFVPPTVFTDISPDSRLAQEEILGPVVCIFKVKDFDEALQVANNTQYALNGGVFSRSPANIEKACKQFMAGNLYINRAITGAMVQRHPFGGFKMSGVGSKAKGPDYLQQFMFCRTIVENTFRSGFAPMDHK